MVDIHLFFIVIITKQELILIKDKDYYEIFNNILNGWLPSYGIQAAINKYSRFIILIYLDRPVVKMFFPENIIF
jgi:hypothetical protein